MGGVQTVLFHYGSRGLLLVGFFLTRKLTCRKKQRAEVRSAERCFNIISPQDYQPMNPRELHLWSDDKNESVTHICPVIEEFKEQNKVAVSEGEIDIGYPELFCIDEGIHYLNHGGYGGCFDLAFKAQDWFRKRLEAIPSKFMYKDHMPFLRHAVHEVADFVGSRRTDLVPIRNVTTAVNCVLQSIRLEEGDLYLMTSLTYPSVRSCIARAAAQSGARILEVELDRSILNDTAKILDVFKAALEAGRPRIKFAVLDHIMSFPPVVMPIQELARMFQIEGCKVLVDGSHAVGSIPLNIPELGVQFYASNMHKWLCTPKGSALLWVDPREQRRVLPCVTSHGCGMSFQQEFAWPGTDDMTGWMAAPAAISVMKSIGLREMRNRNKTLLNAGVKVLTEKWGVHDVVGNTKNGPSMAAVKLPPSDRVAKSASGAYAVQEILQKEFQIHVPVKWWEGALWVRISCQLYNNLKDYETLATAVLGLLKELEGGRLEEK